MTTEWVLFTAAVILACWLYYKKMIKKPVENYENPDEIDMPVLDIDKYDIEYNVLSKRIDRAVTPEEFEQCRDMIDDFKKKYHVNIFEIIDGRFFEELLIDRELIVTIVA